MTDLQLWVECPEPDTWIVDQFTRAALKWRAYSPNVTTCIHGRYAVSLTAYLRGRLPGVRLRSGIKLAGSGPAFLASIDDTDGWAAVWTAVRGVAAASGTPSVMIDSEALLLPYLLGDTDVAPNLDALRSGLAGAPSDISVLWYPVLGCGRTERLFPILTEMARVPGSCFTTYVLGTTTSPGSPGAEARDAQLATLGRPRVPHCFAYPRTTARPDDWTADDLVRLRAEATRRGFPSLLVYPGLDHAVEFARKAVAALARPYRPGSTVAVPTTTPVNDARSSRTNKD